MSAKRPAPDVRSFLFIIVDHEVLAPASGNRTDETIALLRRAMKHDWNIVQRPLVPDDSFDGYLETLRAGGFELVDAACAAQTDGESDDKEQG